MQCTGVKIDGYGWWFGKIGESDEVNGGYWFPKTFYFGLAPLVGLDPQDSRGLQVERKWKEKEED